MKFVYAHKEVMNEERTKTTMLNTITMSNIKCLQYNHNVCASGEEIQRVVRGLGSNHIRFTTEIVLNMENW